ncbi:MAG: hypothetical protein M1815_004649 [Lichina confinis]|nr:MAG: hypothetical protein M1815_004649 [Lichina confinis]
MVVKRPRIALPSSSTLGHGDRLPRGNPIVARTLSRMSRSALLVLALYWLSDELQPLCAPCLLSGGGGSGGGGGGGSNKNVERDGSVLPLAASLDDAREIYEDMQNSKGSKKEVVHRIVEGDWRHGLTLIQLAMADVQYLFCRPSAHKWIALEIAPASSSSSPSPSSTDATFSGSFKPSQDSDSHHLPRFHAPSFLRNLQREIGPLMKAHYYLTRPDPYPLSLLRIQIHDTPYDGACLSLEQVTAQTAATWDRSRTLYIALPDGTPHIYVSMLGPSRPATAEKGRGLKDIVLDALPKALSRPNARFVFQPTSLSARTLEALLALRGGGRGSAAAGGWSVFADGSVEGTPLEAAPRQNPLKRKSRAAFATTGTINADASYHPASRPTSRTPAAAAAAAHDKENIGPRTRTFAGTAATTDADSSDAIYATKPRAQDPRQTPRQRRSLIATARFGSSAIEGDGKGIERLEIRLEDVFLPRSGRLGSTTTATTTAATAAALQERHLSQPDVSGTSLAAATSLAGSSAVDGMPMDQSFAHGGGDGGGAGAGASSKIIPGDVVCREGQGPTPDSAGNISTPDPNISTPGSNISSISTPALNPPDPNPNLSNISNISNPTDANALSATTTPRHLPKIRLVFHGSHVFAGVRRLVETGFVDGQRMPGWFTGEDGVSVGVVRGGRMLRGA